MQKKIIRILWNMLKSLLHEGSVLLIKEKKCLVLFMQIRKQAFHDNPPWDSFCLNSFALS